MVGRRVVIWGVSDDIDGRRITATEGRAIVKARYRIPPHIRNRARIPETVSGSAQ